ncbi:hypothetical protein AB6A23_05200 [Paenibacillus tarimensis]
MTNIQPFLDKVRRSVEAHRTGPSGGYRRMLSDPMEADLYGTADAAILLYTLGELPEAGGTGHNGMVTTIQRFQVQDSGLFPGAGHHPIHGTAYAIAALELLDNKPLYPLTDLHGLKSRAALYDFMDGLDWVNRPWSESHKGAGIYAALVLAGEVDREWEDWYLNWLQQQADPVTGLWCRQAVYATDGAPLFHHLASSFHYLFNLNYRKRSMQYPDAWIDTCLALQASGQIPLAAGELSFVELDVLYTLISAASQTGHRAGELQDMMHTIGCHLLRSVEVLSAGPEAAVFEDLHALCGTVCALALVQSILPEQVVADRLLLKVLDRRPFI